MVINKARGTLSCVAIKAPGFGERRKALLEDVALLTGATVISADTGLNIEETELSHLGSARRMLVTKDESTVVEGRGPAQAVTDRAAQLKVQIEETSSDYDREKLQERMASLVGGIAVVKVGGATEPEVNERKSRTDDALAATKAAVEEGIVPGGGVAIVRAEHVLESLESQLSGDHAVGVRMVRLALSAPLILIAQNAGHSGEVILEGVRNGKDDWGFDAEAGKFCNLIAAGIVDPLKVTRSALENAGSVAGMMLTTQAVITEIPEEIPLPADMQDFIND
jgi:chaperonin GroEL